MNKVSNNHPCTVTQAQWGLKNLSKELAGKTLQGRDARDCGMQLKAAEAQVQCAQLAAQDAECLISKVQQAYDRLSGVVPGAVDAATIKSAAQQLKDVLKLGADKKQNVRVYWDAKGLVRKQDMLHDIKSAESKIGAANRAMEKKHYVAGGIGDRVLSAEHPLYDKTAGEMMNMLSENSNELRDGLNYKQERYLNSSLRGDYSVKNGELLCNGAKISDPQKVFTDLLNQRLESIDRLQNLGVSFDNKGNATINVDTFNAAVKDSRNAQLAAEVAEAVGGSFAKSGLAVIDSGAGNFTIRCGDDSKSLQAVVATLQHGGSSGDMQSTYDLSKALLHVAGNISSFGACVSDKGAVTPNAAAFMEYGAYLPDGQALEDLCGSQFVAQYNGACSEAKAKRATDVQRCTQQLTTDQKQQTFAKCALDQAEGALRSAALEASAKGGASKVAAGAHNHAQTEAQRCMMGLQGVDAQVRALTTDRDAAADALKDACAEIAKGLTDATAFNATVSKTCNDIEDGVDASVVGAAVDQSLQKAQSVVIGELEHKRNNTNAAVMKAEGELDAEIAKLLGVTESCAQMINDYLSGGSITKDQADNLASALGVLSANINTARDSLNAGALDGAIDTLVDAANQHTDDKIDDLKTAIAGLKDPRGPLSATKDAITELATAQEDHASASDELSGVQKKFSALCAEVNAKLQKYVDKQSDLSRAEDTARDAQAKLDVAKAAINAAKAKSDDANRASVTAQTLFGNAQSAFDAAKGNLDAANQKVDAAKDALDALNAEIESAVKLKITLEREEGGRSSVRIKVTEDSNERAATTLAPEVFFTNMSKIAENIVEDTDAVCNTLGIDPRGCMSGMPDNVLHVRDRLIADTQQAIKVEQGAQRVAYAATQRQTQVLTPELQTDLEVLGQLCEEYHPSDDVDGQGLVAIGERWAQMLDRLAARGEALELSATNKDTERMHLSEKYALLTESDQNKIAEVAAQVLNALKMMHLSRSQSQSLVQDERRELQQFYQALVR